MPSIVFRAPGSSDPQVIDRLRRAVGTEGLERIRRSTVAVIGIGALGRRISTTLGNKGYNLVLVDPDLAESGNLHQGFCPSDVGENKALAAGNAIAERSPFPIAITAIPAAFTDGVDELERFECDLIVASTHDYGSRFAICRHFYQEKPVVTAGIGGNLLFGWVFVQEPRQACLKCALPVDERGPAPCPAGMLSDIAEATAALVCFAVDSLVLPERPRFWNYRVLSFSGDYEVIRTVERRVDCPWCQSGERSMSRTLDISLR